MSIRPNDLTEDAVDFIFNNLTQSNKSLAVADDFSNKELEQIEIERRERIEQFKVCHAKQIKVLETEIRPSRPLQKLRNSLISK